jgi:hypothetical protein
MDWVVEVFHGDVAGQEGAFVFRVHDGQQVVRPGRPPVVPPKINGYPAWREPRCPAPQKLPALRPRPRRWTAASTSALLVLAGVVLHSPDCSKRRSRLQAFGAFVGAFVKAHSPNASAMQDRHFQRGPHPRPSQKADREKSIDTRSNSANNFFVRGPSFFVEPCGALGGTVAFESRPLYKYPPFEATRGRPFCGALISACAGGYQIHILYLCYF